MPPVLEIDRALPQLASLPLQVYEEGAIVLAAGATTGKLVILKEGAVEVVQGGVRLAEVDEPGALFGELALLLGQPHTADVRALRRSTFHVADGATYLRSDPTAALYIAVLLARRVTAVNQHLVEARGRLGQAPPARVVAKMIDNIALTLPYGPLL
jgi:CRP-like cAMP-binding protein